MSKRSLILCTAIVFGFALVVLRLADLMLLDHERLSSKALSQYTGKKKVHISRGVIYDRRGRELAVNLDTFSAYSRPSEIESQDVAAHELSRVMGIDYRKLRRRVSSKRKFVWLQRKLDSEMAKKIMDLKLKGIGFVPEVKRFYPKGPLAAHVIGFVGIDNQALEGIELYYDEMLKARDESVKVVKDAKGRLLVSDLDLQKGGNSLVLTIDEGLQFIVESSLERAVKTWQPKAVVSIMMNPYTGEILAMANRPSYDLNDPAASSVDARRNRGLTDTYEPGSTFKIITAIGALEENIIKVTEQIDTNPGHIIVGKRTIYDTHNKGVLSFAGVIKASSNVGFVMVGQRLNKSRLHKYIKLLGFGRQTGIDLHGESPGKVRPLKRWSSTTLASATIGYGVAVTPLQILNAYSAIANGGVLVKPHIVSRIISPEGKSLYRFKPGKPERVISKKTANVLKDILVTVTQEGGTAPEASISGNRVAGKTGTARLLDPETGKYSKKLYASSFVGFAPADNPRLALVVVVFEPQGKYYGGQVAAPVFSEIVDKSLSYMNVPREDNFNNNVLTVRTKSL